MPRVVWYTALVLEKAVHSPVDY